MRWKVIVLATGLAGIAFATGSYPLTVTPARAGCENGERIDGSTAADASRKLQSQGYSNVHDLKKGCDNIWYGYASKDGQQQHVSVSPTGAVALQHE